MNANMHATALGTECSLHMMLLILQKDCINYVDVLYMK